MSSEELSRAGGPGHDRQRVGPTRCRDVPAPLAIPPLRAVLLQPSFITAGTPCRGSACSSTADQGAPRLGDDRAQARFRRAPSREGDGWNRGRDRTTSATSRMRGRRTSWAVDKRGRYRLRGAGISSGVLRDRREADLGLMFSFTNFHRARQAYRDIRPRDERAGRRGSDPDDVATRRRLAAMQKTVRRHLDDFGTEAPIGVCDRSPSELVDARADSRHELPGLFQRRCGDQAELPVYSPLVGTLAEFLFTATRQRARERASDGAVANGLYHLHRLNVPGRGDMISVLARIPASSG